MVVVTIGLVVVGSGIPAMTKHCRETGEAYNQGTGTSPASERFVKSYHCVNCQRVTKEDQSFKQYSGYKSVWYCGQRCQKLHWDSHRGLCQAIQQLEAINSSQVVRSDGLLVI